jgi:DNA-binding NtrC family response regulator
MLRDTGGNKVDAARKLGIGLRTLYRKIEKWAL